MTDAALDTRRLSAAQRVLRAHNLLHEDISMRRFSNNFLPADDVLADTYGTTRNVIRKVLTLLTQQGVIQRRQGLGTFVTASQLRFALNAPAGEQQFLSAELGISQVQIASVETIAVPGTVASALQQNPELCACIEYVQFVNGQITTLGTSYLLDPRARQVREGLFQGGLQSHLRTYGMTTFANEVSIQALNADVATAEALGVPEGHALIYTRRVAFDEAGRATELTYTRHRSELSAFVVRGEGGTGR